MKVHFGKFAGWVRVYGNQPDQEEAYEPLCGSKSSWDTKYAWDGDGITCERCQKMFDPPVASEEEE